MLFADTIGQFVKYTSSQRKGTVVDTFVCSLISLVSSGGDVVGDARTTTMCSCGHIVGPRTGAT
jgi:hypothetical protein